MNDRAEMVRQIEEACDSSLLPRVTVIVRLDGRGFTSLTKTSGDFERPFDEGFRDAMVATTEHLFECGFRVRFGYTQSDEISLLIDPTDDAFGRRTSKWLSVLAGEASAKLSLTLGRHAVMDARILQIADSADVVEYFVWRSNDAHRNAISAHAYWLLRGEGFDARAATRELEGASVSDINEFLFQRGVNVNDLPSWQKRGIAVCWEEYEKVGLDPRSGEERVASRRRLKVDFELPLGDGWRQYLERMRSSG